MLNTAQLTWEESVSTGDIIIGIKHEFPLINIRKVPRELLKTEGEARNFQHLSRDLANVNEWQNHVWSLLLHKFKENTPKIEKMFAQFILQPYHHFLTRARFLWISSIRAVARYFFSWWFEGLARALRGGSEGV